MSPPAVNCPPAPVSTTKRTVSSRSSSAKSAESWSRASIDTRLNFPGTSSVIVATPRSPSRSTRKPSNSVTPAPSCRFRRAGPCAGSSPMRSSGARRQKRYSLGRLNRASGDARQWASSASAVTSPTTIATTRCPRRSSGTPTTATSRTAGCRASTSSTSSGWMFSPPEMIMSSTRPSIQRSPSSSRWPVSPVWYQPSRIAFSSASGRCQYPVNASSELMCTQISPPGSSSRRVFTAGRPAQPGLSRLVAPDRERVHLGRAVVVHEHLGREGLDAAGDHRGGHRGSRVPERTHRRDVVVGEARVTDEVVEQGRREVQRGDPLLLDQAQRLARVPAGLGHEAAADEVHGDQRVDPHRVVERHHAERAVAERVAVLQRLRPAARAVGGDASAAPPSGGRSCPTCRASTTSRARRGRARRGAPARRAADRRRGARGARRSRATQ